MTAPATSVGLPIRRKKHKLSHNSPAFVKSHCRPAGAPGKFGSLEAWKFGSFGGASHWRPVGSPGKFGSLEVWRLGSLGGASHWRPSGSPGKFGSLEAWWLGSFGGASHWRPVGDTGDTGDSGDTGVAPSEEGSAGRPGGALSVFCSRGRFVPSGLHALFSVLWGGANRPSRSPGLGCPASHAPYTCGVGQWEPSLARTSQRGGAPSMGRRSTVSPRPVIRTVPSKRKRGTSEPSSAPRAQRRARERPRAQRSFIPRRTAAASVLPPPSPPPRGMRLVMRIRVGKGRPTSRSKRRTARTARLRSMSVGRAPRPTPSSTISSMVVSDCSNSTSSPKPNSATTESSA